MDELTHTDSNGKAVMVDIGQKEIQRKKRQSYRPYQAFTGYS